MELTTHLPSPLGELLLSSDGLCLTGLWLPGQKYYAAGLPAGAAEATDHPVFAEAGAWLDRYFAGQRPSPKELRLGPRGRAFRQLIWSLLLEIPYGETETYGGLAEKAARRLGLPRMSAQAVGGAVGHNPISLIIPCHRVVGTGGSLTGYAGGVAAKRRLLLLEGADMRGLYTPSRGTAL